MSKNKRRRSLVETGLQFRLIATFLSTAFIACLFQVIVLERALLKLSDRLPYDSEVLAAQAPSIVLNHTLLTFAVLAGLTFSVGLVVTHRIAGPTWRIKRFLIGVI